MDGRREALAAIRLPTYFKIARRVKILRRIRYAVHYSSPASKVVHWFPITSLFDRHRF